jgi:transcriptional regulator with XRE-family HTH domain
VNDAQLIALLPDVRLGHLLRAARHGARLRRGAVARASGMTRATLAAAERGQTRLDPDAVERVFSACGTTARVAIPPRHLPGIHGGVVHLGPTFHGAAADDPDAILAAYVAAVRAARSGTGAPLPRPRQADLDVLSTALGLDEDALVERIEAIVGERRSATEIARELLRYVTPSVDALRANGPAFNA